MGWMVDSRVTGDTPPVGASHEGAAGDDFQARLARYGIDPSRAMFTLLLCTFVDVLGYTLILPLLPQVARAFGASDFIVGVLIASNAMTALVFGPVLGRLSDRFGRRRVLMVSMLGTLASFTLLAFSTSVWGILLSRAFDGVFSGQVPIIRAYVADVSPQRDRSHVMGKIMAAFSLGLVLGPAIGGVLGEIDWRYPVFFAMVLSALGTVLVYKILPESMPPERRADAAREKAASAGTHRFFSRRLLSRLVQILLQTLGFNAFVSTLPLVLLDRFSVSPSQIGLLFSLFGLETIIFTAIVLKPMLRRFGEAPLLVASIALLAISFFVFPFIDRFEYLFLFITPPTVGMAFFRPIIQSALTKAVHESQQGFANGWGSNMQGIAQSIAPLISSGFLEAGSMLVFGIVLNAYFLIGWFIASVFAALLVIVILDIKTNPGDFEARRGPGRGKG